MQFTLQKKKKNKNENHKVKKKEKRKRRWALNTRERGLPRHR
jgi:hypothetical protein